MSINSAKLLISIASVSVIHLVKSALAALPSVSIGLPSSDMVIVCPFCLRSSASFFIVFRPLRMDSSFLSGWSWSRVFNGCFCRKLMSVLLFWMVTCMVSVLLVFRLIWPCLSVWSRWRIVDRAAGSFDRGCHFFSAT